ncbi:MAG: HEAT repeat domain-containing protein [Treponema sp.]|jgi:outer membrane protein assembly factor BamB|nr:HEAT repeat domain-containing protein [Treponema sp.]
MKNKLILLIIIPVFIFSGFAQQRVNVMAASVGAAPLWERQIGDTVRTLPHLQASSIVLVGERGTISSFYRSGTHLWNFDAMGIAAPFIARSYEGATYLSNTNGMFMTINRIGRELWRLNLERPITHNPVVGWDGRVFIPIGSMVTCRTASGNGLWSLDLGSPIAVSPILDSTGSFVTVLQNNNFIKLGQFSHIETIALTRRPVLIVSLDEGGRQSYVLLYQGGEMEKINFNDSAREGSKLSRTNLSSLPAPPVSTASHGANFAVTLRDGRVLHINAGGNILWTRNSHDSVEERGSGNLTVEQTKMIYDERGVYTLTARGVSSFSPEGRRRFVHRLSVTSSTVPALSDEGLLYVCGTDNILRVYKIDTRPRSIPLNRFYGHEPEGSYGMDNPPSSPWSTDRHRFNNNEQDRMYEMIKTAINNGNIGTNEPVYVAYMMEMISHFIGRPDPTASQHDVRPMQRVRLINLLAQVGSRETIPFLWNIFDRDREPAVRRACADAIGTIGVDPTGRSFYSYHFLLSPNDPLHDPQLVLGAAASIARLCRFAGPPLAPEGLRVLRFFTLQTTLPLVVRTQIREEIDALFREGLDKLIE